MAVTPGPCSNDASRQCIWFLGGESRHGLTLKTVSKVTEFDPLVDFPAVPSLSSMLRPRQQVAAASGPCLHATTSICIYAAGGGAGNGHPAGGGTAFNWGESLEMARPVTFTGETFKIASVTKNTSLGTATIHLQAGNTGFMILSGKNVKPESVEVKASGPIRLPVTAKGPALRILRRTGSVTVTLRLTFQSTDQPVGTRERQVRLVRR